MIILLLLCAVLHPTKQDDKDLPAIVSWLPTTTILTFSVTNTTSSNNYTIKPSLGAKSLRITWSEQADSNGNHLRDVKDLKNENQKSSFNETEHNTECMFGKESSWRIFRRLPEDEFWLLCDDQLFVSIPLSSYEISTNQMMTVDLTAMTGSYNLGYANRNFFFECREISHRRVVGHTKGTSNMQFEPSSRIHIFATAVSKTSETKLKRFRRSDFGGQKYEFDLRAKIAYLRFPWYVLQPYGEIFPCTRKKFSVSVPLKRSQMTIKYFQVYQVYEIFFYQSDYCSAYEEKYLEGLRITLGYKDKDNHAHVLCGTVNEEEATTDIIKKSCDGQEGNHMNFKADRISICEIKIYGKPSNDDDEIKKSGKESGNYAVSFKSDTNSGFESKFTLTTEEFDEIIEDQWDSLVMKIIRYNETTEKNETIKDIANSTGLVTIATVETQDSFLMFLGAGLQILKENDAFHQTVAVRQYCTYSTGRNNGVVDHNFCRNPDSDTYAWCWTEPSGWNYCNVPSCEKPGVANLECSKTKAFYYRGTVDNTSSGEECSNWNTPAAQAAKISSWGFIDDGGANYCRVPQYSKSPVCPVTTTVGNGNFTFSATSFDDGKCNITRLCNDFSKEVVGSSPTLARYFSNFPPYLILNKSVIDISAASWSSETRATTPEGSSRFMK
eukprot:sb/3462764/